MHRWTFNNAAKRNGIASQHPLNEVHPQLRDRDWLVEQAEAGRTVRSRAGGTLFRAERDSDDVWELAFEWCRPVVSGLTGEQVTDDEAVLATFEDYAAAYCAKDLGAVMAVFDPDDDISLIGTGADELCTGHDQIRAVLQRNFADATADRFEWHWRHVTRRADAAVVAASLTIHLHVGDAAFEVPVRWTVTLHRRGAKWQWLHRHASSAASSQTDGAAYPDGMSSQDQS